MRVLPFPEFSISIGTVSAKAMIDGGLDAFEKQRLDRSLQ
jgi:hypothetical protein